MHLFTCIGIFYYWHKAAEAFVYSAITENIPSSIIILKYDNRLALEMSKFLGNLVPAFNVNGVILRATIVSFQLADGIEPCPGAGP